MYRIIPFPMEFVTDDVDLSQFLIGDSDSFGVLVGVENALDCEPFAGGR
jgi:hypothetical protein